MIGPTDDASSPRHEGASTEMARLFGDARLDARPAGRPILYRAMG